MNFYLQCISCGRKSSRDEASAPLVRQPYMRTQSLVRSYRRRSFRSAASSDWRPSLTAISEDSSDSSIQHLHQQQRSSVRSEKMKRSRSSRKSRARRDSVDCRSDSFSAMFATSAATPLMF